ncbi:MAG: transcriptional regulator [Gammaproteobacteria bacterium CG_4_10_14_0_8_um_filter_38_16]|nr:MAG: transcriptional regulator [Gammaproteobacteria bacterium CG_4_10_14_0_8_um_filter_38_16]PJA03104.1 MAG: transcriptional regulator [Gammaproteobacteria bacterium CG_4_10_14_0_2_um_filter_38_22]PJB10276.1 MAG: transcriptional regulator [Gammaproteobacteria bacterium CG_4_9_14_3_um_filter_38_9]
MYTKHSNLVKIGDLIRTAREEQGYSQDEFAAAADLGRTYYGRVERGEQNVSIQNLIRIALTLKLEVWDLIPPASKLKKAPARLK